MITTALRVGPDRNSGAMAPLLSRGHRNPAQLKKGTDNSEGVTRFKITKGDGKNGPKPAVTAQDIRHLRRGICRRSWVRNSPGAAGRSE